MTLQTLSDTLTFRFITVLVLIVGLTIPTLMVWLVVDERESYQQEVAHDIAKDWGLAQSISGPFLAITPISVKSTSQGQSTASGTQGLNSTIGKLRAATLGSQAIAYDVGNTAAVFYSPLVFDAKVDTEHEMRSRGIFTQSVYTSTYALVGHFEGINPSEEDSIAWSPYGISRCALILSIADTRAIRSIDIAYDGVDLPKEITKVGSDGLALEASIPVEQCVGKSFNVNLVLRGSEHQLIALNGEAASLEVVSTWPHPKFVGRPLPDTHNISDSGFTANWSSIDVASGFPKSFNEFELADFENHASVGYEFFEPASFYSKVSRAVKYGFLAIGLTMMSIFCADLVAKARFHLIQYAVVGAGLALFFLLLLALAEHIGYLAGYLVAATTLTILITGYAWFSVRSPRLTAGILLMLVLIYSSLYLCISSADYALLIGTGLLVLLLIGLMYATRGLVQSQDP